MLTLEQFFDATSKPFWVCSSMAVYIVCALVASLHAIVYKRESRAAVGWVGVIWLSPLMGSLFYFLFGINRIRRKASKIRGSSGVAERLEKEKNVVESANSSFKLAAFTEKVVALPLTEGNQVQALIGGDQTYPRMLEEIRLAKSSICLCSYIFSYDQAGKGFVEALGNAVKRGVKVCVLEDGLGARYSRASVRKPLLKNGVEFARFLPTFWPWHLVYINLRNHRKLLVIDGKVGFTGGLNIREGNLSLSTGLRVQDIHFRLLGPIVAQLQAAFCEDWEFATGKRLTGQSFYPRLNANGSVRARGIPDGPDENFEKVRWVILGAISSARSTIRIQTPYFLPDASLITALNVAAISGISVEIMIPQKSNLSWVHWASMGQLWQLLEKGCLIYLSPPPFDHSKLMVVDDQWVLLGSSNWDPRSLRLNFEFNVECYERELATQMISIFDEKKVRSTQITLENTQTTPFPIKARNGFARLFSPYL